MKTIRPMLMGLMAILIGSAMLVSAIVMSNTLVYTNEVQGISLGSTWTNGAKNLGQEYSFTVSYVSPTGTPNALITFEFDRAEIVPANITLAYYTGTAWVNTTFVSSGPDAIVGTTLTITGGSSGGYDYKLTYNAPGSYTMKVWAG